MASVTLQVLGDRNAALLGKPHHERSDIFGDFAFSPIPHGVTSYILPANARQGGGYFFGVSKFGYKRVMFHRMTIFHGP